MTAIHQLIIGNIGYQHKGTTTLFSLPCMGNKASQLSCLLLDEKGRTKWDQSLQYSPNQTSIQFQIAGLKPGSYNFWIEVESKMHIQQICITGSKRKGLIEKFFQAF